MQSAEWKAAVYGNIINGNNSGKRGGFGGLGGGGTRRFGPMVRATIAEMVRFGARRGAELNSGAVGAQVFKDDRALVPPCPHRRVSLSARIPPVGAPAALVATCCDRCRIRVARLNSSGSPELSPKMGKTMGKLKKRRIMSHGPRRIAVTRWDRGGCEVRTMRHEIATVTRCGSRHRAVGRSRQAP